MLNTKKKTLYHVTSTDGVVFHKNFATNCYEAVQNMAVAFGHRLADITILWRLDTDTYTIDNGTNPAQKLVTLRIKEIGQ